MRRLILAVCIGSAACGGSHVPGTGPTPGPIALAGEWSGSGADSSGTVTLTWRASQLGSALSGPVSASTPNGPVVYNGTLLGSLDGTTLSFLIRVPQGGMSPPFHECVLTLAGSAPGVSANAIRGNYAGTNSCTGPVSGGTLALTR